MKEQACAVIICVLMAISWIAAESTDRIDNCQRIVYENGGSAVECDLNDNTPIAVSKMPHNGYIDQLHYNTFTQDGITYRYQRLEYCDYTHTYRLYCGKESAQ